MDWTRRLWVRRTGSQVWPCMRVCVCTCVLLTSCWGQVEPNRIESRLERQKRVMIGLSH